MTDAAADESWRSEGRLRRAGVLALVYFITGRLGLELYIAEGTATLVWAPTGFAIAAMLLLDWRTVLPGVFLGALMVTLSLGLAPPAAIAISAGNTAEALAAGLMLQAFLGRQNPFATVRGTLLFIGLAGLLATAISAFVGAGTSVLAGIRPAQAFWDIWLLWWMGDVAGALLLAPPLYLASRRWLERHRPDRHMLWGMTGRHAEFALVLALAVVAAAAVYGLWLPERVSGHLTWLPFLFLLWAARRFSPLATVGVSLAVSIATVWSTLAAETLLDRDTVNERLVYLYSFLFAQATAALLTSAFVHERRLLLHELVRAREEAQRASEQKSRFLANMSHEIRTPLNGIIGMASLLGSELTDRQQREKVRIIQSGADSLLNILNDVLDLARIEAGKLAIHPRPFEPRALVRDVTGLFEPQAELKGLVLRARVDGNVPVRAISDDHRLRQVLVNLLSNAIKFTDRGSVELHLGVSPLPGGRANLLFTLRDTGIGIEPGQRERVFDPFVQADNSASRRKGGAGLGLAISRQLAQQLGGHLALDSSPGVGTCVELEVPVETLGAQATGPVNEQPAAPGARHWRVLVAEDNAINAQVVTQMLEKLGHRCHVVGNGDEVLACWREGFDLLLLDCQMPVRDGYATARAIRAAEAVSGDHLPIVALTANAMPEERERCLAAGMDDYLAKPLRLEALRAALARQLDARGS